ncbi:HBL/NHE enterotoxin family protein [Streptomyces vinaceus]|uniref:HBL/NHE enterotoxin family protein n=1 Tax=Streptomyces vinaceus TaxID=1960 RepID=UPI00380185D8
MEDLLIPVGQFADALSDVCGVSTSVELAAQIVLAQPDVDLTDTTSLSPSMHLARENAASCLENLLPELRSTYTKAKSFAHMLGSLTESEVEELVSRLDTAEGKREFAEVIRVFKEEADTAQAKTAEISGHLSQFGTTLAEDLRNFRHIRDEAITKHEGTDGKLASLVQEMAATAEAKSRWVEDAAKLAAMFDAGVTGLLGVVDAGRGVSLFKASLAVTPSVTNDHLKRVLKAQADSDAEYTRQFGEAARIALQPAVLQWLSDTYSTLGRTGDGALASLVTVWGDTSNNLDAVGGSVQGVVSEERRAHIRKRLIQAIGSAKELKSMAEKLDFRGPLPLDESA